MVFDLDDTLFDCWTQCAEPAHREAAAAMVRAGLRASEEAVLQRRLALVGVEDDVDAAVARAFPCDDPARAAEAGRRAFFDRDPGPVTPHPFATEVLRAVRRVARTVLLTTGHPPTQKAKVERLGIGSLFDEVLYADLFARVPKRDLLLGVLARTGLGPTDLLVVGDRPTSEIQAALDLHCRALRIRAGEFARQPTPLGVPEAADVRAVLEHLGPPVVGYRTMSPRQTLTHLEDATLRFILSSAAETDGWLDLTRISSRTARQLPDVQKAVARLRRRGLVAVDPKAPNTDRWLRFLVPGVDAERTSPPPKEPVP